MKSESLDTIVEPHAAGSSHAVMSSAHSSDAPKVVARQHPGTQ